MVLSTRHFMPGIECQMTFIVYPNEISLSRGGNTFMWGHLCQVLLSEGRAPFPGKQGLAREPAGPVCLCYRDILAHRLLLKTFYLIMMILTFFKIESLLALMYIQNQIILCIQQIISLVPVIIGFIQVMKKVKLQREFQR
jgi:hypothetical protein